jgi:hypothetical protein
MAAVTAMGMSGIANSTSTGVPATKPHGKIAINATSTAKSSHRSWRRSTSDPRR